MSVSANSRAIAAGAGWRHGHPKDEAADMPSKGVMYGNSKGNEGKTNKVLSDPCSNLGTLPMAFRSWDHYSSWVFLRNNIMAGKYFQGNTTLARHAESLMISTQD